MLNDASCFSHIYLLTGYTDMRKGIDGLIAIVAGAFNLDPTENGSVFLNEGTELLVVNALRFTKPHHSHQLVDDALAFAHRVGAKQTLLIHVCHDIGLHESVNRLLPEGVQLAYDGQEVIL